VEDSGGAIAGIVIGAVVVLAVIALLAYVAWTIRRKHRLTISTTSSVAPHSNKPPAMSDHPPQYPSHGMTDMDSGPPAEMDAMPQRYEMTARERENEAQNPQPLPIV
jgi:flagellar basal body-associated protein FliL